MKAAFVILLLSSSICFAKPVQLQWASEEAAAQYEVSIERDGKSVINNLVTTPQWEGQLDFGAYVYKIRAIDFAGRPGQWSADSPLIVKPPKGRLRSPENKKTIEMISGQSLVFDWEPILGISLYQIEILKNSQVIYSSRTDKTSLEVSNLNSGAYTWRITGLLLIKENPLFLNREWATESSDEFSFLVIKKSLLKPKILFPIGEIWPSSDGYLKFSWEPVKGAVAYRIKITAKTAGNPQLESVKPPTRVFQTETASLDINVGDKGSYYWSVTPLSSASENAEMIKIQPETLSSEEPTTTTASFQILQNELEQKNLSQIIPMASLNSFAFEFTDKNRNVRGKNSVASASLGLRYELSPHSNIVHSFDFTSNLVQERSQNIFLSKIDWTAALEREFGLGWWWKSGPGFEIRQLPKLAPLNNGNFTDFSTLAVASCTVSGKMGKHISRYYSAEAEIKFFYPISLISGESGGKLTDANLSAANLALSFMLKKYIRRGHFWNLQFSSENRDLTIRSSESSGGDLNLKTSSLNFGFGLGFQF